MLSFVVQEPQFDFNLIFWLLAILLPALVRVVGFVFQLVAKVLGIELKKKETPDASNENAPESEVPAPDPEYPVFQELEPEPRPEPKPKPKPVRPVRTASTSSRRTSRRTERKSLAASLEADTRASFTSSLGKSSSKALPTLQSDFRHTTETPTSLPALASDPELQPPATAGEWRRAILLQEILAPPLALRREQRPGELPPFEFE